jgi:hypothetical protein
MVVEKESRNFFYLALVIGTACLLSAGARTAPAQASTQATPEKLLQSWQRSLDQLSNSAFESEFVSRVDIPWRKPQSTLWQVIKERHLRSKEGPIHLRTSRWDYLPSADAPRLASKAILQRTLWDGKNRLYAYIENYTPRRTIYRSLTIKDGEEFSQIAIRSSAAVMEGFWTGEQGLSKLLLRDNSAAKLTLRQEQELVDGTPCFVIEAAGDFGRFFIWIDPAHDYNAARVELRQEGHDKVNGQPLPLPPFAPGDPSALNNFLTYEVIRFQKVEATWVVAEARIDSHSDYDNHATARAHKEVKRTSIELNPHFNEDDFTPDFPDGTDVHIENGVAARQFWRQGKIEVRVDDAAVGNIDRNIQGLKSAHPR